ncbi:MAG: glycosyltransferase [Candidatus Pseudobacter hemicellulosilyticus]|uniref:Glycosyltransferase n=1 Tax=Candidatus Pseudobacter hemicellulosilyticus TaxID=3121375 RepID=A0AAJ5WUF6_9BACT|nr:MAG: glycosyltransferase [Pseudobacter sp.]
MSDFYLLIPCYNNEPGLIRSLQSVQYPDGAYTIVVVDDGSIQPLSKDKIIQALSPYRQLILLRLPQNRGITEALNTGLRWIADQGPATLVARLDCGDLCHMDRFYRQVRFLQQNPEVQLVGSWCTFRNFHSGENFLYKTPTIHNRIIRSMHFRNVFIHPTVMWRLNAENPLFYPIEYPHAEDYGFFNEILTQSKSAILPFSLVDCEINPSGLSLANRQQQIRSRIGVVRRYGQQNMLKHIGILKLHILKHIPYNWLYLVKIILYKNKLKSVNV